MDSGNRFRVCRVQSFYKFRILSENYAARFARAAFSGLFERRF
jgi:hypothetical protein